MSRARSIAGVLMAGSMVGLVQHGFAQSTPPIVQWTGVVNRETSALELSATVQEGWHVYAATQLPGGPTPLQVTLGEGADAQLTGVGSGTTPLKRHDTSFDLDTEFYAHAFTIHWPLVWHTPRDAAASLPVVVRYQSCSDRECLPPKTIRLSVPVNATVQQ